MPVSKDPVTSILFPSQSITVFVFAFLGIVFVFRFKRVIHNFNSIMLNNRQETGRLDHSGNHCISVGCHFVNALTSLTARCSVSEL